MSHYEQLWLIAFIKTQLIEISMGMIGLLIYSRYRGTRVLNTHKHCAVIFIASAMTHPLLWFVFPKWRRQLGLSYKEYIFYGEIMVFVIEGLWYMIALKPVKNKLSYALLFSLFINLFSYLAGVYLW